MYKLVRATGITIALASSNLLFSQATSPSNPPFPSDLHDHNRAIASGSALMVTQGGSDQQKWKKVEVKITCAPDYPVPEPAPTEPNSKSGGVSNSCFTAVHYVTHFELAECPDGRAFLLRSGEGVQVISAVEGWFFEWAEATPCQFSDDPSQPIPSSGNEKPESLTSSKFNTLDKNRPLDFKHMTKIAH